MTMNSSSTTAGFTKLAKKINFAQHKTIIIVASIILIVLGLLLFKKKNPLPEFVSSEKVQTRTLTQNLRYLGRVEAEYDSQLAFSRSGIIKTLLVKEGDMVKKGQLLVSLDTSELQASKARSTAEIASSMAQYQKIVAGERLEDRAIQNQVAQTAQLNVEQTISKYDSLIADSKRTLNSSDLAAQPTNLSYTQTAPKISGTYLSDKEGDYKITIYGSNSSSGLAFEYSGLESGSNEIAVGVPVKLGTKGLSITFNQNNYINTSWTVSIPNVKGDSYARNYAAYNQLIKEKEIAVTQAQLSATTQDYKNKSIQSGARTEDIQSSAAGVQISRSGLSQVISQISSSMIRAPFDGMITNLNYKIGEFASSAASGLRLVSDSSYLIKVQVPETDIFYVKEGESVEVAYDALPGKKFMGTISHVELGDSVIDGTRVYKVTVRLAKDDSVTLRPGLTASVFIPISLPDVPSVSKDAVIFNEKKNTNVVFMNSGDTIKITEVSIGRVSDDGFLEIRSGIKLGDTVQIPELPVTKFDTE